MSSSFWGSLCVRSLSRGAASAHRSQQISLHYLLSFTHEGYGNATSLSNLKGHIYGGSEPPYKSGVPEEYYVPDEPKSPVGRKANAAIVMLGVWSCTLGMGTLLTLAQPATVT